MKFRNKRHCETFNRVVKKLDKFDPALMSAVYLCTAEPILWAQVSRHVGYDQFYFASVQLSGSSPLAYTLFCFAKDIYGGTTYFSVSDLVDTELVDPKLFRVLCTAMAIRRDGLNAIDYFEDQKKNREGGF